MPPLTLNRSEEIGRASGIPATKVSYKFPVSWMLESPKCPATIKAEFVNTPSMEFELAAIIDQAMVAAGPVLLELVNISVPELAMHINHLRDLLGETAPAMPLLLRIKQPPAGGKISGLNIEMQPLLDLAHTLTLNAPIPSPSR